ncbi:hypothetical protein VKT23_018354 [Stygiomarasmius scandens]|uniref:Uncharacterized protein n=1 Tax=Marasmiellus scandens TaxID=2682957 RepID=A0ABR1IRL4_9AGAR
MRPTLVSSKALTLSRLNFLIRKGKYAAASRVRDSIVHSGETIPPDTLYRRAVAAAMLDPPLTRATEENLYNWVHLLPCRHELVQEQEKLFQEPEPEPEPEDAHDSDDMHQKLTWNLPSDPFKHPEFRALYTNGTPKQRLDIILQICKIAASKGYLPSILKPFLHYIVRSVTPVSGTRMLLSLEEAALVYEKERIASSPQSYSGDFDSQSRIKDVRTRLKGVVIRACCRAGWTKEARIVMRRAERGEDALVMPKQLHDHVRKMVRQKKQKPRSLKRKQ